MPKTKYNPLIYGVWLLADGSEVMFSRSYHPLWVRRPGELATKWVNPDPWVHNIQRSEYFWDDVSYRRIKHLLRRIEEDFVAGRPIDLTDGKPAVKVAACDRPTVVKIREARRRHAKRRKGD
jgi:hypothetical protein